MENKLYNQINIINPLKTFHKNINEISNYSIPNLVENSEVGLVNDYEDKNDTKNEFIKNEHKDIVKKFQKLLLKQDNELLKMKDEYVINVKNSNKNNGNICKENVFNINPNVNNNHYHINLDPDIILSKIKKYNDEMDQMQKELMNNYCLNNKLSTLFTDKSSNIKYYKDNKNVDQQIEEISLKSDFWKASNLAISRKELDAKEKENNNGEDNYKISSKPFLKIDNYVSWEE